MILQGRESDLASCLLHLLRASRGENKAWNLEWAKYHLGRATQGMNQDDADLLHDEFDRVREGLEAA